MKKREVSPSDDWDDLASWWSDEITDDAAYRSDVYPLYAQLTANMGGLVVDLGCGQGQAMPTTGTLTVGVDLSQSLLNEASSIGPVARMRLPNLACFRTDAFDHAGSIYLVDLIEDDKLFFAETARVVKPGGSLAIVINHPAFTAPGSAPIGDIDGEVLWRWGAYDSNGSSSAPAGHRTIDFCHRPLGELLTTAAGSGWSLAEMYERPLSREAIDEMPGYEGQERIPRLLGVRWLNGSAVLS